MSKDQKQWEYFQTQALQFKDGLMYRHLKVLKTILKFKKSGTLLEMGPGYGDFIKKASKHFKSTGVDITKQNIDYLNDTIKNVEFICIKPSSLLPIPDNSFDIFVASEVFEHLSDQDLRKYTKEARRVIKKDGIIVITVPANENLRHNECCCPECSHVFHRWGHKQQFTKERFQKLFRGYNITVQKVFMPTFTNSFTSRVLQKTLSIARLLLDKLKPLPGGTYVVVIKN
jgi:ubiquinone/menaquinone biosynthesis C-methylase UbiE